MDLPTEVWAVIWARLEPEVAVVSFLVSRRSAAARPQWPCVKLVRNRALTGLLAHARIAGIQYPVDSKPRRPPASCRHLLGRVRRVPLELRRNLLTLELAQLIDAQGLQSLTSLTLKWTGISMALLQLPRLQEVVLSFCSDSSARLSFAECHELRRLALHSVGCDFGNFQLPPNCQELILTGSMSELRIVDLPRTCEYLAVQDWRTTLEIPPNSLLRHLVLEISDFWTEDISFWQLLLRTVPLETFHLCGDQKCVALAEMQPLAVRSLFGSMVYDPHKFPNLRNLVAHRKLAGYPESLDCVNVREYYPGPSHFGSVRRMCFGRITKEKTTRLPPGMEDFSCSLIGVKVDALPSFFLEPQVFASLRRIWLWSCPWSVLEYFFQNVAQHLPNLRTVYFTASMYSVRDKPLDQRLQIPDHVTHVHSRSGTVRPRFVRALTKDDSMFSHLKREAHLFGCGDLENPYFVS